MTTHDLGVLILLYYIIFTDEQKLFPLVKKVYS